MTHDELRAAVLVEQYARTSRADAGRVLAAWTEAEQARHRAELLAAIGAVAPSPQPLPAGVREHVRPPSRAIRRQLIDDLPPDSRDHTLAIRAIS
jgi:hypothetical protein